MVRSIILDGLAMGFCKLQASEKVSAGTFFVVFGICRWLLALFLFLFPLGTEPKAGQTRFGKHVIEIEFLAKFTL